MMKKVPPPPPTYCLPKNTLPNNIYVQDSIKLTRKTNNNNNNNPESNSQKHLNAKWQKIAAQPNGPARCLCVHTTRKRSSNKTPIILKKRLAPKISHMNK
jgi:hypothetical protein